MIEAELCIEASAKCLRNVNMSCVRAQSWISVTRERDGDGKRERETEREREGKRKREGVRERDREGE